MMMTRVSGVSLILVGVLLVGGWWYVREKQGREVCIEAICFSIEVAHSERDRARGLGGRATLCGECALLFLFDADERHAFWMKDMLFSIDIAWADRDGKVVWIERAIPVKNNEIMAPPSPARFVLETNAGALRGVSVGDRMSFRGLSLPR